MMKKSLVALAALAVVGAASAQSTVTLFGGVDIDYQNLRQGGATVNQLGTSGLYSSRLGFRGTEDLGGGLAASFWLEAGVNPDSGTGQGTSLNNQTGAASTGNAGLVFNRRSTLSLVSASVGELRLGRDYTPTFWNLTVFDPFGTLGSGQATALQLGYFNQAGALATAVRSSNSIQYLSPGCADPVGCTGVYGQLMYAFGENSSAAANSKDGNTWAGRIGFAQGPFNVALAAGTTKLATGDVSQVNIGGSYNFGVATLIGQYDTDKKNFTPALGGATNSKGWLLGATIPVGAGYIPLSYQTTKDNSAAGLKANKFAIGYVYNLSKRTSLYTTYSSISNKNGSALAGISGANSGFVNATWTGLDVGVKHSF
jgi:predicted porin